ncbi:restriction endonuclease FokI C-terminal domain-containing protein [Segetibacter koreensis]|uniref:restriction endonuclease FokI C-terminal domain-containing protein n=1 Tax=Segetibacter koreensis TaxID=398037 RepID=UPI000361E753|nr:restriction endonuclease FokI C-terminal domain-containing protein [Segetibacter koreensis]
MLTEETKSRINAIWFAYSNSNKKSFDTKGNEIENIDGSRVEAIKVIKKIIGDFLTDKTNLLEFKTNLDSYNKQNNYWGFTAAKGQMFFNLLTKSSENELDKLSALLKKIITEPTDLDDALSRMQELFVYTSKYQLKAIDKRKCANPKSAAYFLSYFWQIHDFQKWPVMYSSLINSFEELGIWEEQSTPQENYKQFYNLNEEIKNYLIQQRKNSISNWEIEHAFWHFSGTVSVNWKQPKKKQFTPATSPPIPTTNTATIVEGKAEIKVVTPGFELTDYLIPKVCKLVELGASTERSSSSKGHEFEKMVGEVFRLLDFELEMLGQGAGREPDAIIKFSEEHVAFIIDAKAYSLGYSLGTDDRAIREYINYYCPKLRQAGFNKIGFIIVSNSFKSNLHELVNSITWNTDVKRFILLTSEALLYLLAYKTKDRLPLNEIIDALISYSTIVTKESIIEKFGDY